jgi:hypothetical protein
MRSQPSRPQRFFLETGPRTFRPCPPRVGYIAQAEIEQRREGGRRRRQIEPALAPRMDERRSRSVACASLSKLKTVPWAGVVGWWRRRTADPVLRVDLRRAGALSCGVVIGSFVLAWVIAATGSRLLLGLVFMVFVGAVVTLFAVVIAWCQASGDEIDAADPVLVMNRGVIARTMRRLCRSVVASAQRASRVWLSSTASIVTGLASRLEGMVATFRREVTRDAVARWVRAAAVALSGTPPPQVSPPAGAGRLGRPRAALGPARPATVRADAVDSRDLHRGTRGVSTRQTGPTAHPKPIHWSLPVGTERHPDG